MISSVKIIKNAFFLSQQGNTFVHNKGDNANRNSKGYNANALKV